MRRAERGGCTGSLGRCLLAAASLIRPAALAAIPASLTALLIASGQLAAQSADQVQAAVDKAIHRLDLQTEFPRAPEPPTDWHLPHLPQETLWVVIAIAIGILLFAFRDTILAWQMGDTAWAEPEGELGAAAPRNEAVVLEAADELAAAGRFVEAMHVLLLQGLAYMRVRLDQQFSDSLTSREILHSTKLPEAARTSLHDVIARVELTYFGKRPAALPDYTACRASFNALTQALHRGASA